ncbi:T9SS type A sorting domain-containing protein [Flavitalea sp. BT771]|uniref:T9SS type A sorting domain-containing protein n=1 Tax=Flavitalea sp. BT771 TaxID=3063329 RepID=UPI0026E3893E|nr:T9SS type A sorting domain-containing protein [Flavitalea sp. BT771]MDO6432976.1 T9SS type A sorting domain-containing protein [Flavitalea sp. BT771]MDV6221748.1 T9SS type A sorting domain-containing protein [Flavitalea sp. BT771]
MKVLFTAWALLAAMSVSAQLSVGSSGIFISGGTTFYTEGLTLIPTSNLTITSDTIAYSTTPRTGPLGASINKVFTFTTPITFTGTLGIRYLASDLNGNTESLLQLAIGNLPQSGTIVTTTNSTDGTPGSYYVSNASISGVSLGLLTATNFGVTLPVALLAFYATSDGASTQLRWQAGQATNFDRFIVERSTDGAGFHEIGVVNGAGEPSYAFTDDAPAAGMNYYRLKMEDLDGSASYSEIVSLKYGALPFSLAMYPNPVMQSLTLRRTDASGGAATVVVTDQSGRILMKEHMEGKKLLLDLSRMPGGIYLVQFRDKDHVETMKVSKL